MLKFDIELTGLDSEKDARSLAVDLASYGRVAVTPLPAAKGLDPVTMIVVTAAVLQSIYIIYRFYQDLRQKRQARARAQPTLIIILADGTRIQLADTDMDHARLLIETRQ
jgi:hypothetical protein